jgi:hypothetical protein
MKLKKKTRQKTKEKRNGSRDKNKIIEEVLRC